MAGLMKGDLLAELERELHDLCQPVTALQFRLELGVMCGDPVSLREAAEGGLVEAERICKGVEAMREMLKRERDRE